MTHYVLSTRVHFFPSDWWKWSHGGAEKWMKSIVGLIIFHWKIHLKYTLMTIITFTPSLFCLLYETVRNCFVPQNFFFGSCAPSENYLGSQQSPPIYTIPYRHYYYYYFLLYWKFSCLWMKSWLSPSVWLCPQLTTGQYWAFVVMNLILSKSPPS